MTSYPEPERVDQKDMYHGTVVHDPYRYMEDSEDPRTLEFIEKNNILVDKIIDSRRIEYYKHNFAEDYEGYEMILSFTKKAGKYFYQKRNGNQAQPVIYSNDGNEKILLDINSLSDDGTTASTGISPSPDGRTLAVTLSVHGSDWQSIFLQNLETGEVLEKLEWVRFTSIAWQSHSSGFYYQRFPDQNKVAQEDKAKDAKIYYHKIGTSQDEDILVFTPEDKTFMTSPIMYGENLFLHSSNSTMPENELFYKKEGEQEFIAVVPEQIGSSYMVIGTKDDVAYILTSHDASNLQIMSLDLKDPKLENLTSVIPESNDAIASATLTGGRIAVVYLKDAHHVLKLFDLNGEFIAEIGLPTIGTISLIWGDIADNELIYIFESYFHPRVVFAYDHSNGKSSVVNGSTDTESEFEVKQVFYSSKDGTSIPMFLTYKKNLKKTGANPTYLYGYGGFKISLTPSYQPHIKTWLRDGGIYAVANIRGGGEYGKQWHDQGLLEKKQNVFDDFIAAAEYLIHQEYTNPRKLAINGRSNGGLLVGAVLTQRPDLFGVAVPQVGVLDMLRYQNFTVGRFWLKEYGDPHIPEHFKFLIKYSPLHNIRNDTEYPPTLITAAEGDNRVVPAHTLKFAATLQYCQKGSNPILMRIERKAGHGFGKPLTKIIEDLAYKFAFISQMFSLDLS